MRTLACSAAAASRAVAAGTAARPASIRCSSERNASGVHLGSAGIAAQHLAPLAGVDDLVEMVVEGEELHAALGEPRL